MGASPSKTRTLTVENDDPTSVIKVSEDVVDRIKGNQVKPVVRPGAQQFSSFGQGVPVGAAPVYLYEPSLTTIQLRQANVAELKKNDEYWENRVRALETKQKKISEIMDEEYNKAVEELQGKSVPHPNLKIDDPCLDSKSAVMDCYKKYCDQPMKCAKVVQAFQECVDCKRQSIVANRG